MANKDFKMGEILCPICGADLNVIDTFDIDESVNNIFLLKVGECPKCKKEYTWEEKFEYAGYRFRP